MEKCTNRGATTTPKVLTILADIVFWISSVFILLSVIVGFTTEGGALSGIILLLTAVFINPFVYKTIKDKLYPINRWMCIIILFVGFIAGMIAMPT